MKTDFHSWQCKNLTALLVLFVFSFAFLAPSALADHTAIITIDPSITNCDDLGDTFTVNVKNDDESLDSILQVEIYKALEGISDLTCGPAPAGWELFSYTDRCIYVTERLGSSKIAPDDSLDFTFDAVMNSGACASLFTVVTVDDNGVQGDRDTNDVDVKIDCSAPIIEKTVGEPKLPLPGYDPNNWWITQDTVITVNAYEQSPRECDLGLDYCEITYSLDGGDPVTETLQNFEPGVYGWDYEWTFDEDSEHVIDIVCYDVAGNKADWTPETDKVDSTPPVTTKTISEPKKVIPGDDPKEEIEWIDTATTITLDSEDGGDICAVGVDKIWYMNVIDLTEQACWDPYNNCVPLDFPTPYDMEGYDGCIDDWQDWCTDYWIDSGYDSWEACVDWAAHNQCGVDPLWKLYDGTPVNQGEQSCHVMQYFAVDDLGNIEDMNVNCFFVDKTPPEVSKVHPEGSIDDYDEDWGVDFTWLTTDMPITFRCTDPLPHPSGDEQLCYKVSYDDVEVEPGVFDWGDVTDGYCEGDLTDDGYCCVSATPKDPFQFYFQEESKHSLDYYCMDAVEKKSDVETQYYKVDDTPPSISKTMIGTDHLGYRDGVLNEDACPPTPGENDECYVKDSGENGVHVDVTDGGDVCAVGVDADLCNYGLWWFTSEAECHEEYPDAVYDEGRCAIDSGRFGSEGFDIIFHEDSTHRLYVNCWDKLGNKMMPTDIEDFLVDSTPPVTTKTYGDPLVDTDGGYPKWITSDTPITLTAEDAKVGVDTIYKKVTLVDDSACWEPEEYCSPLLDGVGPFDVYETPFTIGEDSCHMIEYYSVDLLGNVEDVKSQCIFVDNVAPEGIKEVGDPNVPVGEGDDCVVEDITVDELDVLFLFDLTGSMGGVISDAKADANNVMNDISSLVPDSRFGVGSFMDYPDFEPEGYCGYYYTYGDSSYGDYAWDLNQDLTTDTAAVSTAINGLSLGFGEDGPEAYARALWESQGADWRPDAKKVVVIFQDNVPHDCHLGDYDASCESTTGPDPGPDAIAGTSDDITWDGLAAELAAAGISVISIDSDTYYTDDCRDAVWGYIADETGGASAMLGTDFTDTIVSLVSEVIYHCDTNLDWYVTQNTPIMLSCDDSWDDTVPHPVNNDVIHWRFSTWTEGFEGEPTYSEWYSQPYLGEPIDVNFPEDCWHDLEFYCEDGLENEGFVDTEYFIVDTVPPVIEKTMNGPYEGACPPGEGDICYVDTATSVTVNAYDQEPHPVDGVECYYEYDVWEGDSLIVESDTMGPYEPPFDISFPEESQHNLHIWCHDALMNVEHDYETFYVDKTPPGIWKQYGDPYQSYYFDDYWAEWITSDTPVYAGVTDDGPHKSGISEVKYRTSMVDNEDCMYPVLFDAEMGDTYSCDETEGSGDWTTVAPEDYDEFMFTVPEDSCHLIEIMATDNVGKCNLHKQWVYVDNQAPEPIKTVGDPKTVWDGTGALSYDDLTDFCQEDGACWKITMLTPIDLACVDQDPHPVDHETVCFKVELDAVDATADYCEDYEGNYDEFEDGFCCLPYELEEPFLFGEVSEHSLEYYCVDALGNTGPIDEEKFKVEETAFEIQLNKKWNLVSVPVKLLDNSMDVVFNDVSDTVEAVWTWDPDEGWLVYSPDGVNNDNLDTMLPGWGYWIYSNDDDLLVIGGSEMDPGPAGPSQTKKIVEGWNLIGYYGAEGLEGYYGPEGNGKEAYCALYSLGASFFDKGWAYLGTYWEPDNPDMWKELDKYDNMDPGAGYWLLALEDGIYGPTSTCDGII